MQSDAASPLTTRQLSVPTTTQARGAFTGTQARDILKSMDQSGDSPLEWIRNNLKANEQELKPDEIIVAEEAKREAEKNPPQPPAPEVPPADATPEGYDLNPGGTSTVDATPEPAQESSTSEVEPIADAETEIEALLSDVPNVPAAENFKKLRTKLKETAKSAIEVKSEKVRLEKELAKYTSGEVLPEVLIEKENEIQRLSRFEKIHSLKTSKAYQEAYVAPLNQLHSRIGELAVDYDIPQEAVPEFLSEALSITKQSDLNRFLAAHFDDVGALEVKQLINQTREIQAKAREAENEPGKALENLMEEHRRIEDFRETERRSKVAAMSRDSWSESLMKIREEGQAMELIMKENDPDHNNTYVRPILNAASQEYAKFVNSLVENGLQRLPKDVGFAIARMIQLAHASAISIKSRNEALKYAENLTNNVRRTANMVRPPIGSSGGGSGALPAPSAPSSPSAAADTLLNKVMRK